MRLVVALPLAAALACAPPASEQAVQPPAVDTAGFTQAITDLWARYEAADTAGNAEGVLALFAPNARLDTPGVPPVIGRAAFDTVARAMMATRRLTSLRVTPVSTTVVSNQLAYQGGTYFETFATGGRDSATYGRFVSAIVRDSTGTPYIAYLMAFADSTIARRQP